MNNDQFDNEQVQLRDIVKRGVATAEANVVFIAIYFAVSYAAWFGLDQVGDHLFGTNSDTLPDISNVVMYILIAWAILIPVGALVDCIMARLLRKQLLAIQPDSGLLLAASLKEFWLRMVLLNTIQLTAMTFALPLYPAIYVVLRYVTAFVMWRNCSVRVAFSGFSRFLSVHLGKFAPVWLVGTVVWIGIELANRSPASANPVFMGLLHLVLSYFDFAVVATALVSFTMLQRKQQEVAA